MQKLSLEDSIHPSLWFVVLPFIANDKLLITRKIFRIKCKNI